MTELTEPTELTELTQVDPAAGGPTTRRLRRSMRGQSLFEYSMIILFVVLAVFLSLLLIAPVLNSIFNQVPGMF